MSNLTVAKLTEETLCRLWHEAEELGRIDVDCDYNRTYTVSILFYRRSGTRIYATGKNSSIHFALADAINEAREMGAGTDE